jgi:hypothetical protein
VPVVPPLGPPQSSPEPASIHQSNFTSVGSRPPGPNRARRSCSRASWACFNPSIKPLPLSDQDHRITAVPVTSVSFPGDRFNPSIKLYLCRIKTTWSQSCQPFLLQRLLNLLLGPLLNSLLEGVQFGVKCVLVVLQSGKDKFNSYY